MLHIILLECALETIPPEIAGSKEVQSYATRRKKAPSTLLLDQTYHGRAMRRLPNHERRGRPDIVFACLLSILESPLCRAGFLEVYLHLADGRIIEVNPTVRLPRNHERLVGLFEQLLVSGKVPPDGPPLMQIHEMRLQDLIERLTSKRDDALRLLALETGRPTDMDELGALLPADPSVPVVCGVGAFPHGDLSESIRSLFDVHVCLDPEVMMAWHVCSEVLWTYTWRIKATRRRYDGSHIARSPSDVIP